MVKSRTATQAATVFVACVLAAVWIKNRMVMKGYLMWKESLEKKAKQPKLSNKISTKEEELCHVTI